jgi:hypothetical protein
MEIDGVREDGAGEAGGIVGAVGLSGMAHEVTLK